MSDSRDLPVTEHWDPEWDVYEVPISPFSFHGEPEVPYELWWACYSHLWELEWITTGTAWYAPHPWQNQLEPPRRPPSWYPGQPDPPRTRIRPCTCMYVFTRVKDAPVSTMVPVRRAGVWRPEWVTRCFVIVFDCPHHGDARYDWDTIQQAADEVEAAFWSTLAEDERRDH